MIDILVINIYAPACGADEWEGVSDYGEATPEELARFFKQDKSCKPGIKNRRFEAGWEDDYRLRVRLSHVFRSHFP